jgi:hypothetical protein
MNTATKNFLKYASALKTRMELGKAFALWAIDQKLPTEEIPSAWRQIQADVTTAFSSDANIKIKVGDITVSGPPEEMKEIMGDAGGSVEDDIRKQLESNKEMSIKPEAKKEEKPSEEKKENSNTILDELTGEGEEKEKPPIEPLPTAAPEAAPPAPEFPAGGAIPGSMPV